MDCPGYQLLAGTALSAYKHSDVHCTCFICELENLSEGIAFAYQFFAFMENL